MIETRKDVPVNLWEATDKTTYDVLIQESKDKTKTDMIVAAGLNHVSAYIYKTSINRYNLSYIEKSVETSPRFRTFLDIGKGFRDPVPMTYDGRFKISKANFIQKQSHPFGKHYKLATKVIISYFYLHDANINFKNTVEIMEVTKQEISIMERSVKTMTSIKGIEFPMKIKQFFTECPEFTISRSDKYKNKYGQMSAREILAAQSTFNELCNQLESDIA